MSYLTSDLHRPRRRVVVFVVLALIIVVAAILQSAFLEDLFRPQQKLRILLPESGISGLAPGATVDVLGTPAGAVEEIVIRPDESFYALVKIDERWTPFIRRDSRVLIQRQFGIAGAAYLEITRGKGAPLDWDYAVLSVDPASVSSESVNDLLAQVRDRALPVVEETHRAITALADLIESLNNPEGPLQRALNDVAATTNAIGQGEGTVGRLLTDDTPVQQVIVMLDLLYEQLADVGALIDSLASTSGEFGVLAGSLNNRQSGLPAIIGSARGAIEDVRKAVPGIVDLSRNAGRASGDLQLLVTQLQVTLQELENMLRVMQKNWLVGGTPPPESRGPLSVEDIRP